MVFDGAQALSMLSESTQQGGLDTSFDDFGAFSGSYEFGEEEFEGWLWKRSKRGIKSCRQLTGRK